MGFLSEKKHFLPPPSVSLAIHGSQILKLAKMAQQHSELYRRLANVSFITFHQSDFSSGECNLLLNGIKLKIAAPDSDGGLCVVTTWFLMHSSDSYMRPLPCDSSHAALGDK